MARPPLPAPRPPPAPFIPALVGAPHPPQAVGPRAVGPRPPGPLVPQGPLPRHGGAPPGLLLNPPDGHIVHPLAVMHPDQIKMENWNLRRLTCVLGESPCAALEWAACWHLVANTWPCPQCGRLAKLVRYPHSGEGVRWHCRPCSQTRSGRMGSWFENAHLTMEQTLIVTYCWCYNTSGSMMQGVRQKLCQTTPPWTGMVTAKTSASFGCKPIQ